VPKYQLIDDSDNSVGFVVVNAPEFQQMQSVVSSGSGYLSASGPVAESVLFLVVVGGCTGASLVVGAPGWLSALLGVGGGLAVASIRAWRSGVSVIDQAQNDVTTVQVEQVTSDGRHWVLGDFDEALTLSDLQAVAREVIASGFSWSRSVTTKSAGISQGKHNKLQDDLSRLWYVQPLPNGANGYLITRQGRRFFEAVASLPSE